MYLFLRFLCLFCLVYSTKCLQSTFVLHVLCTGRFVSYLFCSLYEAGRIIEDACARPASSLKSAHFYVRTYRIYRRGGDGQKPRWMFFFFVYRLCSGRGTTLGNDRTCYTYIRAGDAQKIRRRRFFVNRPCNSYLTVCIGYVTFM